MGLDVKYRPRRYGEVLGQEDTVRILRSFVSKGIGFHQSYLFHGPYGSGKFIDDLTENFAETENLVTSRIDDREMIVQSIRDFLGKGR